MRRLAQQWQRQRRPGPGSGGRRLGLAVGLLAVVAATMGAGPATAAPIPAPRGGIINWLFPPAPGPGPSTGPTPDPTSSGIVPPLPGLPGLPAPPALPGLPTPKPSASKAPTVSVPADPAQPTPSAPASAAGCRPANFPSRSASGRTAETGYAAALSACKRSAVPRASAKAASQPEISTRLTTIKATRMTMTGLSYDGETTLHSTRGGVRVLQFSADTVELEGMDQTYSFTGGQVRIRNTTGNAVLKGNVKLYVTTMTAKVFGLVELTFDPAFPPPVVLQSMFFTDATTTAALISSDTILLPDLSLPVTG